MKKNDLPLNREFAIVPQGAINMLVLLEKVSRRNGSQSFDRSVFFPNN